MSLKNVRAQQTEFHSSITGFPYSIHTSKKKIDLNLYWNIIELACYALFKIEPIDGLVPKQSVSFKLVDEFQKSEGKNSFN